MIRDLSSARFVRSSFHGANAQNCVEVAKLPGGARAVRDSKDRDGGVLVYGATEWAEFLAALRSRGLD
ncbi:MAG TPA: DUF397 domain-containing protein [Candidatus Dormibacteraeota bacterium]|jgi:hypothetical protein|nr:DUF397 domain-containing protein [Candidatus Dormibacteraeota bacterium]